MSAPRTAESITERAAVLRPGVATVVTARDWEPRLADAIRSSGRVRLVLRAVDPDDIVERFDLIDVVVVGAETPWLSAWLVAAWRRLGMRVVGVYATGDAPARRLFDTGGADDVLPDSADSHDLISAVATAAAL